MKILLLGKNGQVGWELQRSLSSLGELIALDRHEREGLCGDLARPEVIVQAIRAINPSVIVNAAAYTAVDKAEIEADLAFLINAKTPGIIAQEAARIGSLYVHYSSDYVFDGTGDHFWKESDPTLPQNTYGQSKLAAERLITASACKHLIFRTSWVYCTKGNNFAKTILRLASKQEHIQVVEDQIGAPTGAELIADITAQAILSVQNDPELCGIYHLTPRGQVSWYDYANAVINKARLLGHPLLVQTITPILSTSYPTPAKRPANSRLCSEKLSKTFAIHLPHWEKGVNRMIEEYLGC